MKVYEFEKQSITSLSSVNNDSNNFYSYKDLHFLSKLSHNNQHIIFSFHGSVPANEVGKHHVIFRGYNYNISNTDIVCISDFLLSKYNSIYSINWTLPTKKYDFTDDIYKEIFSFFINAKKYKKIIFTGTSAGGFPSLKFASFFNAIAIISNSQLYIENYKTKDSQISIEWINGVDDIIYENKMIENIILKSKPKQIIYYQNENDTGTNWHDSYSDFLQFKSFAKKNELDDICQFKNFKYFNKYKVPHSVQFPDNKKHLNILRDFLAKE